MTTTKKFKTNLRCGSCIATLKPYLDRVPGVDSWAVDIASSDKTLTVAGTAPTEAVKKAVSKAGYQILSEIAIPPSSAPAEQPAESNAATTYYPLLLLVAFLAGGELIVRTNPAKPLNGRPVTLELMIHAADGTMVKDFEVTHEEKVHLVIVRDGLDHFAHIHPAVDAQGNLIISHTFPVGGRYRLFTDYTSSSSGHATATGSLAVGGESPFAPSLVANAPGSVAADGVHASISASPLKVGEPAHITFAVQNEEGSSTKLEPYMGALGHLMFVNAAGQYVHVHPVTADADRGTVEFEANFAEPGLYKGWAQFKQGGMKRVIPLVIKVG